MLPSAMTSIYFNSNSERWSELSNFSSCRIEHDGMFYPSVEAAYQASKTADMRVRVQFTTMPPLQATAWGRRITLRRDWENVKVRVMDELLRKKFTPWTIYALLLDSTDDQKLIHLSPWDGFWGSGKCNTGENVLGKMLMLIRSENRQVTKLTGTPTE